MKEVRFIHTADLHLDTPFKGLSHLPEHLLNKVYESTFRAFEKIIDLAIKERCHFIIIAGDLYDAANRSLRAQSFLRKQFERLLQYQISVYIIHGNHDHLSGKWVSISWPENVHFFGERVECKVMETSEGSSVHLYGFSYPKREVFDSKVTDYEKEGTADFHIGILHGQAEGASGHDPYAPFKVSDLDEKDFNYWALGHIHQYMRLESTIFYPGNIQGRHRNELGEKGCLFVCLKEGLEEPSSVTFYPTSEVIWDEVSLDIKDLETVEDLRTLIVDTLEGKRRNQVGVLLHIVFGGSGELHHFITNENDLKEIITDINEEEAREDSFVYIVSHKQQTSGVIDIVSLREKDDFLGDVARLGDEFQSGDQLMWLQELYGHRKGRNYLSPLSDEEFEQIKQEAQYLILSKLMEEWEK